MNSFFIQHLVIVAIMICMEAQIVPDLVSKSPKALTSLPTPKSRSLCLVCSLSILDSNIFLNE